MSGYEDWKFTQSRLYTMKLKYNWLICLGYILEPSLNPLGLTLYCKFPVMKTLKQLN